MRILSGDLPDAVVLDDDLIIEADNAGVLGRLPDGAFDLIYVDPPFNTGKTQRRGGISYADVHADYLVGPVAAARGKDGTPIPWIVRWPRVFRRSGGHTRGMKLYVCYGLFNSPRPGGHPCRNAHDALVAAGHTPEVKKSYGLGILPDVPFNQTSGRKRAKELTGTSMVPVLELDDGTAVGGSAKIVAWAKANPAGA